MPPKVQVKTKTAAKTAKKPPAKAAGAAKPIEKKVEAARAPQPTIVWDEIPFKQIDAQVIRDGEEKIKKSGKWALCVDDKSLLTRFLRHRDVNMITVMDKHDMEPEYIRMALLGSLKYGKPLIVDLMESEMYEYLKEKFNAVQEGLLDTVLSRSIMDEDTYMALVKEEDSEEFQNKYNYQTPNFSFLVVTSSLKQDEDLLQKTYPINVV